MKYLISLALLLVPTFALAEKDFAAKKTKMLSNLEERISRYQEHKNCISAANDATALKKCHEKMKEWRLTKREEMKQKMKNHREMHKKHMHNSEEESEE